MSIVDCQHSDHRHLYDVACNNLSRLRRQQYVTNITMNNSAGFSFHAPCPGVCPTPSCRRYEKSVDALVQLQQLTDLTQMGPITNCREITEMSPRHVTYVPLPIPFRRNNELSCKFVAQQVITV